MLYSVWNQTKGEYDYYQNGDRNSKANAPKPTHLRHAKLGLTVNQASWPLPTNAQRVGSGPLAKGRLASFHKGGGGALGEFTIDRNLIGIVGLGVVVFLLWKSDFLKA